MFHELDLILGQDPIQVSGFDIKLLGVPVTCHSDMKDMERFEMSSRGGSAGEILTVDLFVSFSDEPNFVVHNCTTFIPFVLADEASLKYLAAMWHISAGNDPVYSTS